MSAKEVALEVARFLDSSAAKALAEPRREGVRRVAEAFYGACYQGLGKKPRLLEDHDLLELMERHLPASFSGKDPLVPHVPAVVEALLAHLEEDQVVAHAFELKRVLDEAGERYRVAARSAQPGLVRDVAPVVHHAPKLGRNDPCFCGSGKKFKKCCGKDS